MSELYFAPYEIWTQDKDDKSNPNPLWRAQTVWMLENLHLLRAGRWVTKPSNYVDTGIGKRQVRAKAMFETPVQWGTEITRRLDMCHFDGLLTEAYYTWGETEERLAKIAKTDEKGIRHRIRAVVKYISRPELKGGYWRKNND
jgi:hypothetical protein